MGTFHSMFARILRREAVALGYTPAFTIYDADDSLAVIKRCMESLNISMQIVNPQAVRARIKRRQEPARRPPALPFDSRGSDGSAGGVGVLRVRTPAPTEQRHGF